jgi:hypothetical protein
MGDLFKVLWPLTQGKYSDSRNCYRKAANSVATTNFHLVDVAQAQERKFVGKLIAGIIVEANNNSNAVPQKLVEMRLWAIQK